MRILIAPLDWGLGHATRCIPLIRALRAAGHEPVVCAGGAGLRLLRAEFPDIETENIGSWRMRYTRHRALLPLWLLAQLPFFLLSMRRDRARARRLTRKHGAGLIIADGRYGFRTPGVSCVFVTHQLEILPPGPAWVRALLAPPLRWLNRRALSGFREIWVPDFPGGGSLEETLSGRLGHPPGDWPSVRYIRPLCRFRPDSLPWNRPADAASDASVDLLALVSGPEPQRTLFEKSLRDSLASLPGTRVLVRGKPGKAKAVDPGLPRPGELTVYDHLPQDRLLSLIAGARSVVCRSGYTTLMELAGLGKAGVLLVPTPGQPEQEYLAVHARQAGLAFWQDQDALDPGEGLRRALASPGFPALFVDRANSGFDLEGWIARHPLLAEVT